MRRMLSTFALTLLAAPAFGAVLHTAPAHGGFTGAFLQCVIRNVSTGTRTVTIQPLDYDGNPVGTLYTQTLAPGGMHLAVVNDASSAASCRFDVPGSAKHYSAAAVYWDTKEVRTEIVIPAE